MTRSTSTHALLALLACAALVACTGRPRGSGGDHSTPDSGMSGDSATMADSPPVDFGGLPDLGGPPIDFGGGPRCGDGIVNGTDQCDSGGVDSESCDSDCTSVVCGDRHHNVAIEECDDGPSGSATCSSSCGLIAAPFCGDGVISSGETCDDGNSFSLDGCNSSCHPETGYTCTGAPSVCTMSVGPGVTAIRSGSTTVPGTSLSTSDPTWTRPGSGCVSSTTSGVHYHTYTLQNAGTTTLTLTITATWSGFDGFLAVYTPPFTATSPLSSCLGADDDYLSTSDSQVTGITIAPGAQVVVVATQYSTTSTPSTFTLTVDAI